MTDDEIIEKARRRNLVEYLHACGFTLDKKGSEYYVREKKGLTINANNGAWYYHYLETGGFNAINCVMAVFDMDFKEAVYHLTGQELKSEKHNTGFRKKTTPAAAPQAKPEVKEKPQKQIEMPEKAKADAPLYAYLHKTRGIPYDVIKVFTSAGLLYQTNKKFGAGFKANAVFVHCDRDGNPVGGEVQGLDPAYRYKSMVPGTRDSAFLFVPVPSKDGRLKRAYVFESSIDLMSFYSMFRKSKDVKLEGAAFISLAGLKPTIPKRMQEQGVEIISCVDNDAAGQSFEVNNGFRRPDFVKNRLDATGLKDWNDLLRNPETKPVPVRTFAPVNERYAVRSMMH